MAPDGLPGRLDVADLRDRVRKWVADGRGAPCGRGARVEYVANWGGFVNASFRLRDGTRDVRLKLACDEHSLAGLRRWERVATILSDRHGAPRMLGWTRVPGTSYEGPVFAWVEGSSPTAPDAAVVARMDGVLRGLAEDRDLASALPRLGRTCRDAYEATLGDRFREDLRLLEAEPPACVAPADVAWMRDEAERLAARVAREPAFDAPAATPAHGDLWLENLIATPDGRLVVLDWDDAAVGDPVLDWAMLLGPSRGSLRPPDPALLPSRLADASSRARLDLYGRACLLDLAIDGLADWVDARVLGDGADDVRALKERSVRDALAAYRSRHG